MKKIIPVVVLVGVVGFAGYWSLQKPSTGETPSTSINASAGSAPAQAAGHVINLPPHQQVKKTQAELAAVALSPLELAELKTKVSKMELELTSLTDELDKNLENKLERNKIEEQYKLRSQEYNKLVLQIVKAEAVRVEIAQK